MTSSHVNKYERYTIWATTPFVINFDFNIISQIFKTHIFFVHHVNLNLRFSVYQEGSINVSCFNIPIMFFD